MRNFSNQALHLTENAINTRSPYLGTEASLDKLARYSHSNSHMRISRKKLLPQTGGSIHKFWRTHNKEFLLEKSEVKKLYLENTFFAINHKSVKNNVSIHAFCIMSNHVHESISYKDSTQDLSSYMRIAHGRFGNIFNKISNRQGAVAYDRPKTPLIQPNMWHEMRVHFYIEANPLRAKMIRNLKMYSYSSFRFYAWGIKDEFTKKLTVPKWYLALGKTSKDRQSKYRSLFEKYLKETLVYTAIYTKSKFIGDPTWVFFEMKSLKNKAASPKKTAPT